MVHCLLYLPHTPLPCICKTSLLGTIYLDAPPHSSCREEADPGDSPIPTFILLLPLPCLPGYADTFPACIHPFVRFVVGSCSHPAHLNLLCLGPHTCWLPYRLWLCALLPSPYTRPHPHSVTPTHHFTACWEETVVPHPFRDIGRRIPGGDSAVPLTVLLPFSLLPLLVGRSSTCYIVVPSCLLS